MKNKKLIKILVFALSVVCLCSAFCSLAFAEDQQQNTRQSEEYTFIINGVECIMIESNYVEINGLKGIPTLYSLINTYGLNNSTYVRYEFIDYRDVIHLNGCYCYGEGTPPENLGFFQEWSDYRQSDVLYIEGRIIDIYERLKIIEDMDECCSCTAEELMLGSENNLYFTIKGEFDPEVEMRCYIDVTCHHSYSDLIEGKEPIHTKDKLEYGWYSYYECYNCCSYFNEAYEKIDDIFIFPSHYDNNNDLLCDVCLYAMSGHKHNYTQIRADDIFHWYDCACGESSVKVNHYGGHATCLQKASCIDCGYLYGSIGAHSLTEGTCALRPQCLLCREYFGELGKHKDTDKNFVCDTCSFDFIADSEYRQSTYGDFKDSSNKATTVRVGQSLYYNLFDDEELKNYNFRTYYNALCNAPDGFYTVSNYNQQGTKFVNYVDQIQGGGRVYGFKYENSYTDSVFQTAYLYNPYTDSLYNKLEVIICINKNGVMSSGYDVSPTSYTAYNEAGRPETINGIMFNSPGTYEVTMYIRFCNDMDDSIKVMSTTQTFTVELPNVDIQNAYDSGYSDGYNIGFQNGKITDSDFSLYSFVNAIINAPADFIDGMLDFNVFGVHMASFVKMLFTLLLVAFVVFCILKVVH